MLFYCQGTVFMSVLFESAQFSMVSEIHKYLCLYSFVILCSNFCPTLTSFVGTWLTCQTIGNINTGVYTFHICIFWIADMTRIIESWKLLCIVNFVLIESCFNYLRNIVYIVVVQTWIKCQGSK